MVPLLAASSALSVAGSVVSAVQKLTASKGAGAASEADSFGAMLASQGVVPPGAGGSAQAAGPAARHGQHGGSRHVDTLA